MATLHFPLTNLSNARSLFRKSIRESATKVKKTLIDFLAKFVVYGNNAFSSDKYVTGNKFGQKVNKCYQPCLTFE